MSQEIFGHRGSRGTLPENTIPSFEAAINAGVSGIEWDVIVSGDGDLIISHEAYPHPAYCSDSNGVAINSKTKDDFNFYRMTTQEIQKIDCGSRVNKRFPDQDSMQVVKPTVQEAFSALNLEGITILFEIKSEEKDYGVYQPTPQKYAQIIYNEVVNYEFLDQIVFMCFDKNVLEELHKLLPSQRYVYLTFSPFKDGTKFLKDFSFKPYALGMYYRTIKKREVKRLKELEVKTFAWTVNQEKDLEKMIRFNVDGIITDYPEKFMSIVGLTKK